MQYNPSQWKLTHSKLLAISGLIWLSIGALLLKLGIQFILFGWTATRFSDEGYSSLFPYLSQSLAGYENACLLLVALGILVGYVKGNVVMRKAAQRAYARISELPNPAPLFSIYSRANYIILAIMMGLGLTMKFLDISYDVRGFIDTAVGIALIQGAIHFFRFSRDASIAKQKF